MEISGWKPLEYDRSQVLSIVVTAYEKMYPLASLLYALKAQTHEAIEVLVYHDGPPSGEWFYGLAELFGKDQRFRFGNTDERTGLWGYPMRRPLERRTHGAYIGDLCDDDWVCPVYAECLVAALANDEWANVAYCDHVRHLEGWQAYVAHFRRLHIGIGGWIGRRDFVLAHPTPEPYHGESDGERADAMVAGGAHLFHVPRTLIVYG